MNDDRSTLSIPDGQLVVVSGGQTGVDRAALDAALGLEIPVAGWCPHGRRAEDGRIPDEYPLTETDSWNYAVRTEWNVRDSDGTLIIALEPISGGTKLTAKFARRHEKPLHVVLLGEDPAENSWTEEVQSVVDWLTARKIRVLNVAGPRGSSNERICSVAEEFCRAVFSGVAVSV